MSGVVQQEDVADNGKDDEKNLNAAAQSENAGNASGDALSSNLDENLNSDKSDTDGTGDIPKPVSLEQLPVEESDHRTHDSEESTLTQISSNKTIDDNKQNDNIQTEITAKDSLDNIQSIANITDLQASKNLDVPVTAGEPEYKETVIDDTSDSEFELRWSGEENDDDMNAVPLTDEVLKRLDEELGLADTENSKENTPKIITVEESTIEIEKPPELVDKKSSETLTLAQNLIDAEKPKDIIDDNNLETVKTVNVKSLNLDQVLDINTDETKHDTDVKLKQVNQNDEPDSHPIQEKLNPNESFSVSITTELEAQHNTKSEFAILKEAEIPMDVDIVSVESELPLSEANIVSDSQPLTKKTLPDLVKEINVVEENKISEIDIDETIVDLKNLIDQDEDTIKQLGLDVQKSEDKNKEASKTSVEETKSTEVESASVKIKLMEEDISTETKNISADNVVEDVKKLNLESVDILSTKESNSNNIKENDNKKDILQSLDDKTCINSEAVIEQEMIECTNKKTEELIEEKCKGDAKEPTDENPAKTDNNIENDSKQKAEKVICKNVDIINILENPRESNLNEHPENISKVTQKKNKTIILDASNDLIKINTDHRINRPDVMLDIPTQEFDFDDFDDASEMQVDSDKTDKNDSDLTTKTVTEIVNQLAKEPDKQDENQSKITITNDVEMTSVKNISETTDIVKDLDSTAEKTPETSHRDNKTPEKELNLIANDNKSGKSSQKDDQNPEKVPKLTENIRKPDNNQPSTSTESAKDTPNKIPTTQENDKFSEVGLKTTETVVQPENSDTQPLILEAITEEPQEDRPTDSLGLLAEAIRVIRDEFDYEQEPEEDEPDDGEDDGDDDDDDFDPDDEENSNQTGAHSEDGIDSNDNFDTLIKGEIDIEPTQISAKPVEKEDTESMDSTEKGSETSRDGAKSTDIPSTILAKLLTKPATDMNEKSKDTKLLDKSTTKTQDLSIVDLEGSSSEDDVQMKNAISQESPSVIQKAQQETAKMVTVSINEEPSEELEEATKEKTVTEKEKSKKGEVFDLDSDDGENMGDKKDVSFIDTPRENNRCLNYSCTSDESVVYYQADRMTIAFYGAARRRKRAVCQNCLDVVNARNEGLVSGIKDLRPLMSLRMSKPAQLLLEISDSDSEGEDEPLGEDGAKMLEGQLADMLNEVWIKYKMDERLKATEDYLGEELERMQKQSEEVDKILRDCQRATDELRTSFYTSFEGPRREMPGISIHDTPIASYICLETDEEVNGALYPLRYPKRRSTSTMDVAAKRLALTVGDKKVTRSSGILEDDRDISVVQLSAETAPDDLPPPGDLVRPPIRVGVQVYAMKNQYGTWLKGKVLEILPKVNEAQQFTSCRIRFEHKVKNPCKVLTARSIAYTEPSEVRMTIGTRAIALFKNADNTNKRGESYYSGVIAEIPNPVNGYRYLVFFDDGYAQYVEHKHTRLVYESKAMVWEEVHPFSRDFVCNYLMNYPERPMVRMHPGQDVNVERNGEWWDTKVLKLDAALVHVQFPDRRTEWLYRGSTRLRPLFMELQAARQVNRQRMPRSTKANTKSDVPYVEYIRSDDQPKPEYQSAEDLKRQRSVAKKSTTIAQQISNAATDGIISRVVFYTPKNSVKPYAMVPHTCGPQCKRTDLLSLSDLRTYNPLTKPLLSGWERHMTKHKTYRGIMYRAPCGRRLRDMRELHLYLCSVHSDMAVDLFDYHPNTHCLAEFVLNRTNVQKKDLSLGQEIVPIPSVNYYDHSMPEFCTYMTARKATEGVPLNLDPEFLCGCDCEDDCADKTKCACWKMTLEGAKTIGMAGPNMGYHYRRLPEPLPSGIYECNSRCKCKSTCLNRVVQNRLQIKLQVFKTLNRGWGIRALNDVPKGTFICIYAGNLLTDATANLDGLNEGDEYLAELDYIEVVESMKEGFEEDVPDEDKAVAKKETKKPETETESESSESEEEETRDKTDIQDGDFQPGNLGFGLVEFNKRLRCRDMKKTKEDEESKEAGDEKPKKEEGDCITISDDEEEYREPSRFAAQESMTDNKIVSKYRSIRSYFGKDEACYIMDAKVQGNIGRYLNHSCSPNVFVQNVFVDTHDPRFPWVSFFALHHIRAGTELTWNYNYDIGSVPGKVLYCYCGAPNCRGRLL